MVNTAPMMAVNKNSQQNKMAGGGSLLQTASIPPISLSTHEVFAFTLFSFM
jgi:hypothetical protein